MAHSIPNPGKFQAPSQLKGILAAALVIGLAAIGAAYFKDPKSLWPAVVHNHFYFLSLAVGGLFFAAIQWVTGAMWSAPVRRIAERFTSFIPFLLVSFVLIYLGMRTASAETPWVEVVTCAVRDDGSFTVPSSTWARRP